MGGNPCRLKAILNGETIKSEISRLVRDISDPTKAIDDEYLYRMVELLNHAEDLVFKAKRVFLESQGFHGTEEQGGWPYSLTQKK